MTSRADPEAAPRHLPVMPEEVVAALAPKDGGIYVDGTFGAGGHARLLLDEARTQASTPSTAIPRRLPRAGARSRSIGDRLVLIEGRFSDMIDLLASAGIASVDGILLDIGVSSMQLDDGARGFSFTSDGPLDMRMSASGMSAADVVNTLEEDQLKHLLRVLGEEQRAHAVVRAIASARAEAPITRTAELAEIVDKAVGRRPRRTHQPGHPHLPGAAHLCEWRAWRAGRGLGRSRASAAPRRPARRADLSFARGPDRQALPQGALPAPRRARRATVRRSSGGRRPSSISSPAAPPPPPRRSLPIRGPAPRGCVPPSAPARLLSPPDLVGFGDVVQLAAGGGC